MSKLSFHPSRLLLSLLAMLPFRAVRFIGTALEPLLFLCNSDLHRITRINISKVRPELSPQQTVKLVRASAKYTLVNSLEMPIIWKRPNSWVTKYIVSIENEEAIKVALSAGTGLIVVSPHVGNWEVFGRKLVEYGPTTIMYQPPKRKELESLVRSGRETSGARLVPTNQRGVGSLLKALRQGEIIGMLPDQVPKINSGLYVPFFSVPTLTMTLIHSLIKKTNARVVLGYAIRQDNDYRVIFKTADDDIYSDDAYTSVSSLSKLVERSTEESFVEYQWAYKRFRRRPDGINIYRQPEK